MSEMTAVQEAYQKQLNEIRLRVNALKKAGNMCCVKCGLPSGLRNVILVRSDQGLVCQGKCPAFAADLQKKG